MRCSAYLLAFSLLIGIGISHAATPPKGSYKKTCDAIGFDGQTLRASCKTRFGANKSAQLDNAHLCVGFSDDISNSNGDLICLGAPNGAPGGSYVQSCRNITYTNGVINASCKDRLGQYVMAAYRVLQCEDGVENQDGKLHCLGPAIIDTHSGPTPPDTPLPPDIGLPLHPVYLLNPPHAMASPNDDGRLTAILLPPHQPREMCFGALGSHCDNNTPAGHPPREADGSQWAMVSVGSIMHDTCCRQHPDGLHCKGAQPWHLALDQILPIDGQVCSNEWRHAVFDVWNHRYWSANFGPYGSRYGDDLDWRRARRAFVYNRFGQGEVVWDGLETVSTQRLAAPSGTPLDYTDAAYCQSGKFDGPIHQAIGVRAWGICK